MRRAKKAGAQFLVILLSVLLITPTLFSAPLTNADNPWQGKMRPGVYAGDAGNATDFTIDFLMPMWGNDNALFFFNPHLRYDDDDGSERNLGLGYRRFVRDGTMIVGGNIFYDAMESSNDFTYHQLGVGLEALTEQLDLRLNYYHPYGTTQERITDLDKYSFGQTNMLLQRGFEEALRGADAEVGVLIPVISDTIETRVYGGVYWYDSEIRDAITGWKARAEIRPMQLLNLSVEVKDDDIGGSVYVGGYLDLPFVLGDLFAGKNPFAGASELAAFGTGTRDLSARMTDKVIRDRHIVTIAQEEESFQQARDEDGDEIHIIYTNPDNPEDGDGTLDDPYSDINDIETDARFDDGMWIYTFCDDNEAGCTHADVDIDLADDMVLWGEGYYYPRYNLAGGEMPVLDGTSGATVVNINSDNEVMGFEITDGTLGIGGDGVENTFIHDNYIHDNSSWGIAITNYDSRASFSDHHVEYVFDNNEITSNSGPGLELDIELESTASGSIDDVSITVELTDNIFGDTDKGNDGNGATIWSYIYTSATSSPITDADITVTATNNTASANSGDGIYLDSEIYTDESSSSITGANITHTITDNNNSFNNNGEDGVESFAYIFTNDSGYQSHIDDAHIDIEFSGNTASDNDEDGIDTYHEIWVYGSSADLTDSDITVSVTDNDESFNDNGESGIDIESWIGTEESSSPVYADDALSVFISNTVSNNSASGNGISDPGSSNYDGIEINSYIRTGDYNSPIDDAYIINTLEDNVVDNSVSNNGISAESTIYTFGSSSDVTNVGITGVFEDNDSTNSYGEGFDIESYIYGDYSDIDNADISQTFTDNTSTGSTDDAGFEVYNYIVAGTSDTDGTVNNSSITTVFTDNTSTGNDEDGLYLFNYIVAGHADDDDDDDDDETFIVTDSTIRNTLTGNTFSNNAEDGIESNNEIVAGIAGDDDDDDDDEYRRITNSHIYNTVEYNTIEDNDQVGIHWENEVCASHSGCGDDDDDDDDDEFRVQDSSITNTFTENTVTGNSYEGIYIESSIMAAHEPGDDDDDDDDDDINHITNSNIYNTFVENTVNNNGFDANYDGVYMQNQLYTGYGEDDDDDDDDEYSIIDSNITNIFTDNTFGDFDDGNAGDGIYLENRIYLSGDDDDDDDGIGILRSDISNTFTGNTMNDNEDQGADILNDISARDDAEQPIEYSDITNTFEDNTINSNSSDGVYLDNDIWTAGYSSPISNSSITNNFIENNTTINSNGQGSPAGDGVEIINNIYTEGSSSTISNVTVTNYLDDNVLNNNAAQGIDIDNEIWTDVSSSDITTTTINNTLEDNVANGNRSESGSDAINVSSELNSSGEGTSSAVNDTLAGNTVNDSGGNGITLYSYYLASAGTADVVTSLFYESNAVRRASDIGLNLTYDIDDNPYDPITEWAEYRAYYAAHSIFDLGNGYLGSLGLNSYEDNGTFALYNGVTTPQSGNLAAENSWWGSATPDFEVLIDGPVTVPASDPWDLTNTIGYLPSDPN